MKDRKAYWRDYQRRIREARRQGSHASDIAAENLRPALIAPEKWAEFKAAFKAAYQAAGLTGQSRWRARAQLRTRMLHDWGLSDIYDPSVWADPLLQRAKSGARSRKLEFSITAEDLPLPAACPILNLQLDYLSLNSTVNPATPSVDRIDNTQGYVPGNVQVISHRANKLKNDASLDELLSLGKWASTLSGVAFA